MTYKIVERLRGYKNSTQFNSAGELQRHEVSPSPLDLEAASLIQELGEVLDILLPAAEARIDEVSGWPENDPDVIRARSILSKLKDES